jgi:hypothetical protein
MDQSRFDALTRWLGDATRSRRAILQLLALGSLGPLLGRVLPSAAGAATRNRKLGRHAHAQSIPGDPRTYSSGCRRTTPFGVAERGEKCGRRTKAAKDHPPDGCCPGAASMHRDENGFYYPVTGGQRGRCRCKDGYEPDPERQGSCRKIPRRPCVNLNVACSALDLCCQYPTGGGGVCTGSVHDGVVTIDCGISCAIVQPQKGRTHCDVAGDGVNECCKKANWDCETDCQCCGALRCQNGHCVPPPDICHSAGDPCDDGEPCCPGAGACLGGRCCVADTVACPAGCNAGADCPACCAGYCRGDRRCGPVQGCVGYAQPCTSGAECCNDVPCIGGLCRYP